MDGMNPRKHRRLDFEEEELLAARFGKKLRLDNSSKYQPGIDINRPLGIPEHQIEINPRVSIEFQYGSSTTSIDEYLTKKMMDDYKSMLHTNGQIIQKYQPEVLVIYHFQKWVTRLFNRFIAKYNRINGTKIPRFQSFFKIINVINSQQYNFSYSDLFEVVLRESDLELKAVTARLSKPKTALEEIEEESLTFNDIRYDYWDSIHGLDATMDDIEMSDADNDVQMQQQPNDFWHQNPQDLLDIEMNS